MRQLVLDVRHGATTPALLGALVEAGASLEAIEQAVGRLGDGDVRLQVETTPDGAAVRVRAPQGAPVVETWGRLRPRVDLLPLDAPVVELALAVLDALFDARAAVDDLPAAEVEIDPFSGPDDLAGAIALAAATRSLGADEVVATVIGHGTGTRSGIDGPVPLPAPVTARLLGDRATRVAATDAEVLDPVAAAYLAAVASTDAVPAPEDARSSSAASGHGRLPRDEQVTACVVERN